MADTIFYYNDNTTSTSSSSIIGPNSRNLTKTLVSVSLGDTVTTLDDNAFSNCTSLTSISFPQNTFTTIKYNAFYNCSALNSLSLPNTLTFIGDNAFTFSGLVSIIIPDSVTTMGGSANFYGCSNLIYAKISKNLTLIPYSCFQLCSNLISIDIPEGVLYGGYACFADCISLKKISFPNSLKTLDSFAFDNCVNLETVIFGKEFTEFIDLLPHFSNCYKLKGLYFAGNAPIVQSSNFFNTSNFKIYRKKYFVTGWPTGPTLAGKSVVLWSDNVIKSGGTGKLTTKKRD